MTPVEQIAAELVALCFRAGVDPDDASLFAARRVCARVVAELQGSPGGLVDVYFCPVTELLARRVPHVAALVAVDRVVLPRVQVKLATKSKRLKRDRRFASVPLPPAVMAAGAEFEATKWMQRFVPSGEVA